MINQLIAFSVKNKLLVSIHVVALILFGLYAMLNMNVDAVPDITNNQVQVVTVSPSLAPQEVEQFVTYPIEVAMANVQGVEEIRSISRYGLSVVTIVFDDNIPILDARQLVSEMLGSASSEIPEEYGTPELMPITTGLGEIYQYTLEVDSAYRNKYTLMDLRTIHDWIVKRQLSGTKGIVEVSSFGGYVKQYEVAVNPVTLREYDISIAQILAALRKNNQNTGGSYIQNGPYAQYIRAEGILVSKEDIENIVVTVRNGVPVLIKDIATVKFGHSQRYGAMTKDGRGEAVGGITLMIKGGNANKTIKHIKSKIAQIQKSLPPGVHLVPYQDRSNLVDRVIKTITTNLSEAALIVLFVLLLFLGDIRTSIIVTSVIPLSLFFAFILMYYFGVSASVMSLGAIDFGLIVDGSIIMAEGVLFFLHSKYAGQRLTQQQLDEIVIKASHKVAKSAVFGVIIILIVYLPILSLQGIEGKMFKPMALTITFALIGSLLLSLTYIPMILSLVTKKRITTKKSIADKIAEKVSNVVMALLSYSLNHWKPILLGLSAFFLASLFLFTRLGAVFLPTLEEGDLAMQMTLPAGSSLNESIKLSTKAEQILLKNFPEVKHVVSKIGTSEVPTDPMAIEDADIMIIMKDKSQWTTAHTREEMVEKMKKKLSVITGASFDFTQPIQLRFNELLTGAKSDVVIKIYGEDLSVLYRKAEEVADKIKGIRGAADIKVEQIEGLPQVIFKYKRDKIAEYGLNIEELNDVINTALAGKTAGVIFEGEKRFDMVVRLSESCRSDINSIKKLFVKTPSGNTVYLDDLVEVEYKDGPMQIARDNTHRRITIGINVRNRDVKSLIAEIKSKIEKEVSLPPGYYYTYGGQFKNLEDATNRLMIVVPIALGLILLLLFLSFGSMKEALIIYGTIPLSIIGGVFSLWIRELPFSISAGVGFIALFGVAVLNGIVLISAFNRLRSEGITEMEILLKTGVKEMVRPVTLTTLVAALGFIPMAVSQQAGAEVQRPLATVVIGGILVAAVLTLIVIPIFYKLMYSKQTNNLKKALFLLILPFGFSSLPSDTVPITLEKAFEIAMVSNIDVANARYDLTIAEKRVKAINLLGETEFSYDRGQLNSELTDYSFSVMQHIGNPFHALADRKLKKKEQGVNKSKMRLVEAQVKYQITNFFNDYYYQKALLKLYHYMATLLKKAVEIANVRYANGDVSEMEKNYIQERYNIIEWKLADMQLELERTVVKLNRLLNTDSILVPVAKDKFMLSVTNPLLDSMQLLQTSRIAYESAKSEYYKQSVVLQKRQLLPEISAGYFNQQIDNVQGFQGWSMSIALPIWFLPKKQEIEIAKLEYRKSLDNKDFQVKSLYMELKNAYNQYKTIKTRLEYFEKNSLENAQKIILQSTQMYQSGEIEYLDMIQHLNNALSIRENYLDILHQYNQTVNLINYMIKY